MTDFERQVIESLASLKAEMSALKETFMSFKIENHAENEIQRKRAHELANIIQGETGKISEFKGEINQKLASRACEEHTRTIASNAKKLEDHIRDAEKDNGWHDRIRAMENMAKYQWAYMLGCGVLGGGIVSGAIKLWGGISRILGV